MYKKSKYKIFQNATLPLFFILFFYTLSSAKFNKIIYFVIYVKLKEEIGFPQTRLTVCIVYANRFFYVLQKETRNEVLLARHAYYFLFTTFLSQMSNNFYIF